MFEVRDDEPDYARIPDVEAPERNRYGKSIRLVDDGDRLAGKSLNINGDPGTGDNPNRYKQHGFYFNADYCIGCHACEAACSEKNELPAHIAFRSVGYVEGGTYPAYRRLNISMACNHCDNPVCLKGCPTRAYTKFPEYGAVLQDPGICFGCGYCTWVCPYNAPQLDPLAGHVSKCNMCVDRLEVGLKPACAAACLAGALDFGVIETRPENREQMETAIPGFPAPEITYPNVRFQQISSLPRELRRTDSMPLRYEREEQGPDGYFKPKIAEDGGARRWNLKRLRTREDPLVVFTLISQAVIGTFLTLFLGPKLGLQVLSPEALPLTYSGLLTGLVAVETYALVLSTLHLGRPRRFYRAFYNLRYSPVSREVAVLALFYNLLGSYALVTVLGGSLDWPSAGLVNALRACLGWAAGLSGVAALYFMHRIYRIPARPFWNHWQVLTAFYGSMLTLGSLTVGLVYAWVLVARGQPFTPLMQGLAWPIVAGLVLEGVGLLFHARDMQRREGEGAAALYRQRTAFGKTYTARNAGIASSVVATATAAMTAMQGMPGVVIWGVIALLIMGTAVLGRAMFYAVVIPTTMPGAFFWRNEGFQVHARESGLAHMPQVGVVPELH